MENVEAGKELLLGLEGVGWAEIVVEGVLVNYSPDRIKLREIMKMFEEKGIKVLIVNKNDSINSNTKEF